MKKDIIEDSLICLANAKLNDTSYEVARDIALDYIIELKEENERLNIAINKAIEIYENRNSIRFKKQRFMEDKDTGDLMYDILKGAE